MDHLQRTTSHLPQSIMTKEPSSVLCQRALEFFLFFFCRVLQWTVQTYIIFYFTVGFVLLNSLSVIVLNAELSFGT